MIPVAEQPEPADFSRTVRLRGQEFLRRTPSPTAGDFKRNAYWKLALSDLRHAYGDVCAYTSICVAVSASVDHFWPKSVRPHLAYEWSNYRLALDKINSYKGNRTDVLDPFHIQPGWFCLDFVTFYVRAGSSLRGDITASVERTIDILRLNRDDALVKLRYAIARDYSQGDLSLSFLERRYPFIAAELKRQNLVDAIKGSIY
jgi:hypothetical protein